VRNYGLIILVFLFSPVYAVETVGSVKEKLIKGKIKASELTGDKGDWELCFTCEICKDKSFQRFYLRFIAVKKRN
jgi:hypothetical protein